MIEPAPSWTDRSTPAWRFRRLLSLVILVAVAVFWCIPQDVPRMVAEWEPVLLGRYSVERVTLLIVLTVGALVIAKGLGWPSRKKRSGKHLIFGLIVASMVLIPSLILVDIALRLIAPPRYVEETVNVVDAKPGEAATELIRHRPPNNHVDVVHEDVPEAARSYPNAPPGHPPVTCKLTIDSRGFRNPAALETAEIVCLGDSFAEGSHVDDAQTWPVLLAKSTGASVYNLGMSGGGPRFYLATLGHYGLELKPRTVLCMIYAGNDFKVEEAEAGMDHETGLLSRIRNSPIRSRSREVLTRLLGPINAKGDIGENEALSWIPVKIGSPDGKGPAVHYAFEPKRLQRLLATEESFAQSKDFTAAAEVFERITDVCMSRGIRIVFVYAPSAPAVILPAAREQIPAAGLRAFMSYRMKNLPAADEFKKQVFEQLDVQEKLTAERCTKRGAEFIGLTGPLREAAMRGEQVYFTYDQHWTPRGQEVAAQTIAKYLKENAK